MIGTFNFMPQRIFLDSSVLQTLLNYGGFLYDYESLDSDDPIYRDTKGLEKLKALRLIMRISERAPYEFAISENSFSEVYAKNDPIYLRWAYDVLDHWQACLFDSRPPNPNPELISRIDSSSYKYLSDGDRLLITIPSPKIS